MSEAETVKHRNKLAGNSKLTREMYVDECVNMLITQTKTKDIVRICTEKYGVSRSAIEKWIKDARPKAEARLKEAEELRLKVTEEETIEALKSGLKSDLELEAFLCQIAIGDIDVQDTIKGIEVIRGISPIERLKAIDLIYKKRGSYAPAKVAATDKDGNNVTPQLVIRQVMNGVEILEGESE